MAKKGNGSVFRTIFLTIFLDMVGFSVIFPLFPAMLDHYLVAEEASGGGWATSFSHLLTSMGVSGQEVGNLRIETVIFGGLLGSLFAILQFICAPMWGRLSDRIGRKRVLVVTLGLTSSGYLLWVFAGQFWMLLLSRSKGCNY